MHGGASFYQPLTAVRPTGHPPTSRPHAARPRPGKRHCRGPRTQKIPRQISPPGVGMAWGLAPLLEFDLNFEVFHPNDVGSGLGQDVLALGELDRHFTGLGLGVLVPGFEAVLGEPALKYRG